MGEVFVERSSKYWLDDDGIIHGVLFRDADFQMADAQSMMALHRRMTGGKAACLLMDVTAMKSMPREVRAYFQRPEHAEVHKAVAMIVGSPLSRAIGNFFLGLNKPVMPMRLFSDEESALPWLRTHRSR